MKVLRYLFPFWFPSPNRTAGQDLATNPNHRLVTQGSGWALYEILVDDGSGPPPVVQFLPHGILFTI